MTMTSSPDESLADLPEADDFVVPVEADPADVQEQHQQAGDSDEDDYR
jgi:hypothetical protein